MRDVRIINPGISDATIKKNEGVEKLTELPTSSYYSGAGDQSAVQLIPLG